MWGLIRETGAIMYGFWLLILFVILPAGLGTAIAYLVSPAEQPGRKVLAMGAVAGGVIGLIAGVLLSRL